MGRNSPFGMSLLASAVLALASFAWATGTCEGPDGRVDLTTAARALEPGLALPPAFAVSPELRPWVIAQAPSRAETGGGGGRDRSSDPLATTVADLAPETIAAAWRALAVRYGLPAPDLHDGTADAAWVRAAAARVQTVGLRVVDDRGPGRVVHAVGAYWNSPLLPRLRVQRPANDEGTTDWARFGTCAVTIDAWIDVPTDVAEQLLATGRDPHLLAFGPTGRSHESWTAWFDGTTIDDALTFRAFEVSDVREFAAVFAGDGPGWAQVVRIVPRLRGSMGPGETLGLLRGLLQR